MTLNALLLEARALTRDGVAPSALVNRLQQQLEHVELPVSVQTVMTLALLFAARGELADARRLFESASWLPGDCEFARGWLAADAAARGDWDRVRQFSSPASLEGRFFLALASRTQVSDVDRLRLPSEAVVFLDRLVPYVGRVAATAVGAAWAPKLPAGWVHGFVAGGREPGLMPVADVAVAPAAGVSGRSTSEGGGSGPGPDGGRGGSGGPGGESAGGESAGSAGSGGSGGTATEGRAGGSEASNGRGSGRGEAAGVASAGGATPGGVGARGPDGADCKTATPPPEGTFAAVLSSLLRLTPSTAAATARAASALLAAPWLRDHLFERATLLGAGDPDLALTALRELFREQLGDALDTATEAGSDLLRDAAVDRREALLQSLDARLEALTRRCEADEEPPLPVVWAEFVALVFDTRLAMKLGDADARIVPHNLVVRRLRYLGAWLRVTRDEQAFAKAVFNQLEQLAREAGDDASATLAATAATWCRA